MSETRTQASDPPKRSSRCDQVAAMSADEKTREKLIDRAVEDSFPASDPPSYMGGVTTGAPKKRRPHEADEADGQKGRE